MGVKPVSWSYIALRTRRFSILWVDRGGETVVCAYQPRAVAGFSILWVDRGGETRQPAVRPAHPCRFSILWVDRGGETLLRWAPLNPREVSVSSGWIVGVKHIPDNTFLLLLTCFSILWVDRGGETATGDVLAVRYFTFQYPLGGSWG